MVVVVVVVVEVAKLVVYHNNITFQLPYSQQLDWWVLLGLS